MKTGISEKVYPVEKRGEVYFIKEKIDTELKPKFLARNPKNGNFFLLLGDHGDYSVLKGNEKNGLRFCQIARLEQFFDCFAIVIKLDGKHEVITDPDNPGQKPTVCSSLLSPLVELEIMTFEIKE